MQRVAGFLKHASRGFWQSVDASLSVHGGLSRGLVQSSFLQSEPAKTDQEKDDKIMADFDHATGIEKQEIEGTKKGVDIFHEDWITADFAGTPEDPVVVTSAFTERIVGVPDPEDDCLVVWDLIKANEPPKQIIDGGEYFVLKTVEPPTWTGIPESFKGDAHH